MLENDEIEEIVLSSLDPASGFVMSTSLADNGYTTLTIRRGSSAIHPPTRPERVQAQIETSGVELFFLRLDDKFDYDDGDWETAAQREMLTLMTKLAEAYLAGRGREGEKRGFFGRRYSELTLELDGKTYVFRGRRL